MVVWWDVGWDETVQKKSIEEEGEQLVMYVQGVCSSSGWGR